MNYDETITELIQTLKTDKAIVQPWRNKAMARLQEVQAFVRMGRTSTNLVAPAGVATNGTSKTGDICICPPGARDKNCPWHS